MVCVKFGGFVFISALVLNIAFLCTVGLLFNPDVGLVEFSVIALMNPM